MATDLSVSAALITDPEIKASLHRIANQYQRMASQAEQRYVVYLREIESSTMFAQRLQQYAVAAAMSSKDKKPIAAAVSKDNEGA